MDIERCPLCGSTDTRFNQQKNQPFCRDCGHHWSPAPTTTPVSLSEADTDQAKQNCQQLARDTVWLDTIATDWPAPIAHEYQRLREDLEAGQILSAIFQLKDLAEVLIKLPAVILAQALLQDPTVPAAEREAVRWQLIGKPLSLGDWFALLGDTLARRFCQREGVFGDLARLFRGGKKARRTELYMLFQGDQATPGLVNWRNHTLGHGALRLQVGEYLKELRHYLQQLNDLLTPHQSVWGESDLQDASGQRLQGWQTIRKRHQDGSLDGHDTATVAVDLITEGATLPLAPWLGLRRCQQCAKQDIFFFDSRTGKTTFQLYFLDYLAGHRLQLAGHQEPTLADTPAITPEPSPTPDDGRAIDTDYADREATRLLEEKSLESNYLSPDYLRDPLRDFLDHHDRGIYWLQAEAHTGKSVFVHGLAEPHAVREKALLPGLRVAAFHIHHAGHYHPPQLRQDLNDRLRAALNLTSSQKALPELPLDTAHPGQAFADWLGAMLSAYGEVHGLDPDTALLVCLDGLDELRRGDAGGSLLDYIPTPEQLPQRVFLLLTSRLQRGCPAPIWHTLQDRLATGRDCAQRALTLDTMDDSGYRRLLQRYFNRQLRLRATSELAASLTAYHHTQGSLPTIGQLHKALPQHETDALLNTDIVTKALTPLPTQSLANAAVTACYTHVVAPVAGRFATLFDLVLDKSEGRFLYLSLLCELLRDTTLSLREVERLPSGAELIRHYLDELERVLQGKPWDYIKRLLLALSCGEAAALRDAELRGSGAGAFAWAGLSLAELAALLGEAQPSIRLVFALASLKEVLWVDKHQAEAATYRLGLKGGSTEAQREEDATEPADPPESASPAEGLSSQLRQRWQGDIEAFHRQLAQTFFTTWQGRYASLDLDKPAERYAFQLVLAHAELSGDDPLRQAIWQDDGLANAYWQEAYQASEHGYYAKAVAGYSRAVAIYQTLTETADGERWQNDLASAYMGRGNAYQNQGALREALADYDRAIDLGEGLRGQLGEAWSAPLQNDLASAYMNRGNAHANLGALNEAIADYDRAIDLREGLRGQLGDAWSAPLQNDLAMAYMNRGIAHRALGAQALAIADYNRAIDLREGLRGQLGEAWSAPLQNDLASAYMNRGNAHQDLGALGEAIADYNRAINLGEGLRGQLGEAWSAPLQNDLAMAYANRGEAYQKQEALDAAVKDYQWAIARWDSLRTVLEPQGNWPTAWQGYLDETQDNYQTMIDALKD